VGQNTDTTKQNTEALLDASKEVGLEVNPEKTKSCYQKAEQKHSIKIANMFSENVAKYKYFQKNTNRSNLHA
jgi:hypothetical protein